MKVAVVYGTRPEFIKLFPVIIALKNKPSVSLFVVNTGQHKEMLLDLEASIGIKADIYMDVMRDNQTLNYTLSEIIKGLENILTSFMPNWVIIQGDTTTVLAGALASFNLKLPVAHIEAGLRSYDLEHPFPEEFNRRVVSLVAKIHFAPTELTKMNLIQENIPEENITVCGNTVIDAVNFVIDKFEIPISATHTGKKILVTAHRRENHGASMIAICKAVKQLLEKDKDLLFFWPVHPNPNVKEVVYRELGNIEAVKLLEPLSFIELINLEKQVDLIWTDSGGIQEEATAIRKPVLILRKVTERPEVVQSGFGILVSDDIEMIVEKSHRILTDKTLYDSMVSGRSPFGEGNASQIILDKLLG